MAEGRRQPRIVASAKEVAEKILRAKSHDGLGRVIFLIGAGCSVTAGVPAADGIARTMVVEIAQQFGLGPRPDDPIGAYRALVSSGRLTDAGGGISVSDQADESIDWHRVYDEMFERHYCSRDEIRNLFAKIIESAEGAINWAHLCLGELVAKGFVSTILTTNFDQLVLSGLVRAGILPVTCDSIESLNRIDAAPRTVQLVELHGSRHTYILRNRPDDVRQFGENPVAAAAIQGLIQNALTFIVVGYAGREKGVMTLLINAANVFDDKNLFWVQRSAKPSDLSDQASEFLATTRNGGLLLDQDADLFFLELCRELRVGAPSALSEPLKALEKTIADVTRSRISHEDIRREIVAAKAILGAAQIAISGRPVQKTPADNVRELRLAGRLAEAYRLSNRELEE